MAINDSYKPKDGSEIKKMATFFQCAYWINPAIAKHLTKGTLVELYGRIGVNAYKDMQGEPKATLTFHVNNIKLHGKGKPTEAENKTAITTAEITEPLEDLPF